jgi:uncharacterized membrane protein YdcZ (DUF606 family)
MVLAIALDSDSTSYRIGLVTGRLLFLVFIPVFVIALIYWLSGRSRPQPMPFSHAISRWWVWVVGLVSGFVLLLALSAALVAATQ